MFFLLNNLWVTKENPSHLSSHLVVLEENFECDLYSEVHLQEVREGKERYWGASLHINSDMSPLNANTMQERLWKQNQWNNPCNSVAPLLPGLYHSIQYSLCQPELLCLSLSLPFFLPLSLTYTPRCASQHGQDTLDRNCFAWGCACQNKYKRRQERGALQIFSFHSQLGYGLILAQLWSSIGRRHDLWGRMMPNSLDFILMLWIF